MALTAGTRLGPYEVTALIGVGGMGEVYRARDTRLQRDVAIKVLPESFAGDPDRLARFEREAQVLASLNHPNIAAIHGLEESAGGRALVMELVEGPTLDERIRRPEGLRLPGDGSGRPSGLPIDEALRIALQIVDAVEAAHEAGIIHRDLKPANVKVTPNGHVKVLDFGLAKLVDGPPKGGHYVQDGRSVRLQPDLTEAATITSPAMMTGVGMILGTAAYMSPEQARGRPVDKRADIWAFGCVLYEMLTGRRAFEDEDVSMTLSAGAAGIAGASWGEDGTIVFSTGTSGGLRRVAATGGEPDELTKLAPGETQHAWPEILPGGRAVLFTILGADIENAQIAVLDLETGQQKMLLPGGSYPRYSSTGHIVYAIDGTLRAVAFDLGRLEVTGPPIPVLEGVVTKASGAADFALARDGMLVYLSGTGAAVPRRTLAWVDRTGREEPLPAAELAYLYPRISPDGTRVALAINDPEQDIWTWDFARQTLTRLTFDPAADTYPVWSPDSRRLIFASSRTGVENLFWQAADGTGAAERLTESPNGQLPHAITPDGSRIIFREIATTGQDLMLMPLQPPRRAQPLVQTMFPERNAEITPDGRWLAYEANESGRLEIYVRPFPDVNEGRWQVSTGGGRTPLWSRNGQELFYLSPDGLIMGVRVEPGPSWRSSTPERVLQGQYFYPPPGNGRSFDITPDGRRFLMIKEGGSDAAAAPQNRLVFVQHWVEELKRLVPTN